MNSVPEPERTCSAVTLFKLTYNEARAVNATRIANGLPRHIDLAIVSGPRTDKPAGHYDRGKGV